MDYRNTLLAGMALGTAWAVRGQFGHEHGAAWAGALGVLSLLYLHGREDWKARALPLALAGGLGWGIGGIMSYGLLVGYGKALDFKNAYYGLLMLGVVGALYGFTGGAWLGIALSKKPEKGLWPQLMVECTVGAVLCYFFLVEQFGYRMTPPRSELWAACLGVALATYWYMRRNKLDAALRLGLFTAFGAGIGFALGNTFQILGTVYEIPIHWWNVMEYTLGFCGGAAMYYALATHPWPELTSEGERGVPWFLLCLFIPLVMWEQNSEMQKLSARILPLREDFPQDFIYWLKYLPYVLIGLYAIYWKKRFNFTGFYLSYFGLYILLSLLITGALFSTHRPEQYLYLANLALVFFCAKKPSPDILYRQTSTKHYLRALTISILTIALCAWISTRSHSHELPGTNYRFTGGIAK
jgi:hypothetical protein